MTDPLVIAGDPDRAFQRAVRRRRAARLSRVMLAELDGQLELVETPIAHAGGRLRLSRPEAGRLAELLGAWANGEPLGTRGDRPCE